jgi:hypothetical protein
VTIVMHEKEQILVAEVLRRVRARAQHYVDIHGEDADPLAPVDEVAAELGIELS